MTGMAMVEALRYNTVLQSFTLEVGGMRDLVTEEQDKVDVN